MSQQLRQAREEITSWARTLETRVEEKTHELNLAHEHMLLAEKMASIGKLAAIVAHEINNPLAGILTYAKLLKKWLGGGNGARRDEMLNSLDLIETESRRCGDIVRNLPTFARATPMASESTDLNRVIDRCVRLVQHQLELGNIQLRADLDRDLPAVRCDPAQIEQALLAVIMNAIDAMPRGGNLSLSSRQLPGSSQVQLRVGDDGGGIPRELLPHLFEPFFTTKERGHGVGLGLAVTHSIIERYRGRVEVASEPGRGTAVTITLPVQGPITTPSSSGGADPLEKV